VWGFSRRLFCGSLSIARLQLRAARGAPPEGRTPARIDAFGEAADTVLRFYAEMLERAEDGQAFLSGLMAPRRTTAWMNSSISRLITTKLCRNAIAARLVAAAEGISRGMKRDLEISTQRGRVMDVHGDQGPRGASFILADTTTLRPVFFVPPPRCVSLAAWVAGRPDAASGHT